MSGLGRLEDRVAIVTGGARGIGRLRLVGRVVPGTLLEDAAGHPGWRRV